MRFFMLTALLPLLSILAVAEPQTHVVPLEYPTIKAAVAAASPGDTILIKPGQYMETLSLDKAVTLQGESPEQVLIYGSVMAGVIITITSKETVHLENLIIEHSDQEQESKDRKFPDLVIVKGGKAECVNCIFRKSGGCGFIVSDGAQAVVRQCRAENNVQAGFMIHDSGSEGQFLDNVAVKNGYAGIMARDGCSIECIENKVSEGGTHGGIHVFEAKRGAVTLRGNHAENNQASGIGIVNTQEVILESNACSSNKRHGIDIDAGSTVTARQNHCEANDTSGIHVGGILSTGLLEENTVLKNQMFGICVNYAANAQIKNNLASENGRSGILVTNWETKAEVVGNNCLNNGKDGIAISLGASAHVESNACTGNAEYGIGAADEGTAADIGTNLLKDNGKTADTPLPGLPFSRQNQVFGYYAGWALAAGQFDYLDNFAARLAEYKCRNGKGGFELEKFYDEILEKYPPLTWSKKDKFAAQVEAWLDQNPKSVPARITAARMKIEFAWDARGGGDYTTVTEEGGRNFKQYLREAEQILKEAESLNGNDPELYDAWLTVGLGLNYPRKEEDKVLSKGVACDSGFFPLYNTMAYYLAPKWHGSVKEQCAFLGEARKMFKDTLGDTGYAMLAYNSIGGLNFTYVSSGKFADWDVVERGYRQLLEEFSDSTLYLNQFCFAACYFKKRDVAAELFARIGDKPDLDFWSADRGNLYFQLRDWATKDGVPHPYERGYGTDSAYSRIYGLRFLIFIVGGALAAFFVLAAIFVIVVFVVKHPQPPPVPR